MGEDPLLGSVIGRCRLTRLLGRGGAGCVYHAEHEFLGREVAIKILHSFFSDDPDSVRRFRKEAAAASRLNHPNIVPVQDVGHENGHYFLVMPYVAGRNLQERLDAGPMEAGEAARIALEVARGLEAAHAAGIVHRDIKPPNILLSDRGEVKITDFGIALDPANDTRALTGGAILGTPQFLSPEQASGGTADPRSDLYSLGVVLYGMLTRTNPFLDRNPLATLTRQINHKPEPPSKVNAAVPRALDEIAMKLLEKSPDRRYASAAEVIRALERFLRAAPEAPPGRFVPIGVLGRAQGAVCALDFSPDGRLLASGDRTGGVKLWQMAPVLARKRGEPLLAVANPDPDRTLVSVRFRALFGHEGTVNGVAFHPDGRRLASGGDDRTVRIWDVRSTECVRSLDGEPKGVRAVEFDRRGQVLLAAGRRIRLWSVRSFRALRAPDSGAWCAALSPDGKHLACGSDGVEIWKVGGSRPLLLLPVDGDCVESLAYHPGGAYLAAGTEKGLVHVWDIAGEKEAGRLTGHRDKVLSLHFSPDGAWLASGSGDGTVRLWESGRDWRLETTGPAAGAVRALRFSPDGRLLAVGDEDGSVSFWEKRAD